MSLSWDSNVKPKLTTLVNSQKVVKARQSTFTAACLQRLREYHEKSEDHCELNELLLLPNEIVLPDFICEVRMGPSVDQPSLILILADAIVLLAHTSPHVAAELPRWIAQSISRSEWLAIVPEITSHLTLCLHHFNLELINSYSILIAAGSISVEFTTVHYNAQSLYEMLRAAKDLDLSNLFINLPTDMKPTFLGLQSQSRNVSQGSLLSQVPLSSSPCSTKFFKRKFDSLWGYFSFRAPVIENSKMFYGALANPDIEGHLQVTRKAKAKRQKLWAVLKGQTIYMFKKRSSACNAEYEVNLENFNELEILEDAVPNLQREILPSAIGSCSVNTLCLKFANSKKNVSLTPMDKFDFNRWQEMLNKILAGEKTERNVDGVNTLQARRISGLSNSFHNLSSANTSRPQSPTFARRESKHGLAISRSGREMMASCTNLGELSGMQSPMCCSKYMPTTSATGLQHQQHIDSTPIITIHCSEERQPAEQDRDSSEHFSFRRCSLESLDNLSPEDVAELRRRRISTQIQLDCLQAEVKKRELYLSPQQMQTLNSQMSDLYEDIQDINVTITNIDRKEKSTRKKGSL